MDIAKAFTYMRDDENWLQKLGIGAAIVFVSSIIPLIPMLVLVGYELEITRRYVSNSEPLLPEWDDLGKYFMDGLYVTVARLVYASPLVLLFCITSLAVIVPAIGNASENVIAVLATTGGVLMVCVGLLLGIALIFLTPAINIQYIRTGEFGACFRFGEVIGIARDNMGNILLMVVALLVAWAIISIVSTVLVVTVCGIFIATWVGTAWVRMVSGHLVGQITANMDGKSAAFAE